MSKLDEVLQMWTADSNIDRTEPGKALIDIPKLHSKYLGILTKHKIASKKAHFDYLRMKKIKSEYFTGKLSKEEILDIYDNMEDYEKALQRNPTSPNPINITRCIFSESCNQHVVK